MAASRLCVASNGVEVAGKVQVYLERRFQRRLAPAGRAAFYTEYRTERRLTRARKGRSFPMLKSVCARPTVTVVLPSPADVGEIAVTRMSLPVRFLGKSFQDLGANLTHERAVTTELIGLQVETACNFGDGLRCVRVGCARHDYSPRGLRSGAVLCQVILWSFGHSLFCDPLPHRDRGLSPFKSDEMSRKGFSKLPEVTTMTQRVVALKPHSLLRDL